MSIREKYQELRPAPEVLIKYFLDRQQLLEIRMEFVPDPGVQAMIEGGIRELELAFRFALFGDREAEIDPLDYAPIKNAWQQHTVTKEIT